jgi:hypothetical protein
MFEDLIQSLTENTEKMWLTEQALGCSDPKGAVLQRSMVDILKDSTTMTYL